MAIVMPRIVASAIDAGPEESGAALTGFALFFCIFSGYFMLRPVREAMGIAAGVDQLQWLFTATFAGNGAVWCRCSHGSARMCRAGSSPAGSMCWSASTWPRSRWPSTPRARASGCTRVYVGSRSTTCSGCP